MVGHHHVAATFFACIMFCVIKPFCFCCPAVKTVNMTIKASASTILDDRSNVTLVVTSCNREDFLTQLLESIFSHNSFKFNAVIVSEASGNRNVNAALMQRFPFIKHNLGKRMSQVQNIDSAYALVTTPYILHFEEDWYVFRDGFIPRSIALMEKFPKISVVSLHAAGLNEFQQIDPSVDLGVNCGYMKIDVSGGWGFFSWGAGLRRLSDYKAIGANYAKYDSSWKSNGQLQQEAKSSGAHIKKHFIHREWRINWLYRSLGYRVAMFNDSKPSAPYAGYARHCETAKHVPDERGFSPFE